MTVEAYNQVTSLARIKFVDFTPAIEKNIPFGLQCPLDYIRKFDISNEGMLISYEISQGPFDLTRAINKVEAVKVKSVPIKAIDYDRKIIGINFGSYYDENRFNGFNFADPLRVQTFTKLMREKFPLSHGYWMDLYETPEIRGYVLKSYVIMLISGIDHYYKREGDQPVIDPFERFILINPRKQLGFLHRSR